MIITHEIGSLAKPSWRVKPFRNIPLSEEDLNEAIKWAKRLNIKEEVEEVLDIIRKNLGNPNIGQDEKKKIIFYSSLYATRLLENTGIDLVYDGEQHRSEMYEYPIRQIEGFEFKGHVRSFDNKYYKKASLITKPKLKNTYHTEETKVIKSFAKKKIKIPITGPYTLVDWSFNEYYYNIDLFNVEENERMARKEFLKDMSFIIRQNIEDMINNGADFIQIDEPAATTKKNEIEMFVDTIYQTVVGLQDRAVFSIHICFSDYSLLFPYVEKLQGLITELHFEYANRDSWDMNNRKGYEVLKYFKNNNFIVGLGVIDVHTDKIESVELIKSRILYALDIVGDRVYVAPDCGLRTRTWQVAYEKLCNMVEAARCIS